MNKIYKVIAPKKSSAFIGYFSSKFLLVCIALLGLLTTSHAQVSVTASAGNLGPVVYTTLQLAFAAVNNGTHQGAIIANVTGSTTETVNALLNGSGIGSASYTSLLVRPSVTATITGNLSTIIQLLGTDNVTINGLNGVNQLTISNTSTSTSSSVIWMGSASSTDGASNNTIKNCIIKGNSQTTTFIAVVCSSGSTLGGVAEAANSNNTYQNNTISAAQYGIALVGPIGNESGNVISGNTIGSIVAGNKMSVRSIFVAQQQGVSVTGNTIMGNSSTTTTPANTGIYVGGTISGGNIEKNTISDIKKASVWGCSGIQLSCSVTNANLTISNNFIYDVAAGGFPGTALDDNGYGIAVSTGGGYNIWYNSVNLNTDQPTSSGTTAALWVSPSVTTNGSLDVKNNIFSNAQTNSTRYSVFCAPTNGIFSAINYNDYYSTGGIGSINGAAQATLANWQTATGQDAASVAVNPSFFSPTNLHLFFNSTLDGLATPIPAINRDIDGDGRNAVTPDIGADEFTPPTCSSNSGGTVSATFTTICASSSTTLSSTGYSYGIGISYQWQSFSGVWTDIPGQTNPLTLVASGLVANTDFRLKVICTNCCGGAAGYSNVQTITVNNPTVSGTTAGTRCGVGTVNLAATSAGGTLNWYASAVGGSSLFTGSPFTTPVINSTTTYYVSSTFGGSSGFVGPVYSGSANNSNFVGSHGIAFTTTQPQVAINSVDIAFTGTGTFTIALKDPGNSTIFSTFTTPSVTGLGTTALTIPITMNVTTAGSYLLIVNSVSGSINNLGTLTGTYPYSALAGVFTITSGYWYATSTNNMYLFNLNVSNGCEGSRTPVTATVTAPPAFTSVSPAAGAPRTICAGSSVTLDAQGGGYSSVTWNPGALSNPVVVSPASTTTYTVTATTATCRRDSAITITVTPAPTPIIITPATATVCANTIVPITATGGQYLNQSIFTETFETFPLTNMTVTGSGVTAAANTTYYSQGTQSVLLTHGNNIDGQLAQTSSIDLSTLQNPTLTFSHICGLEDGFDYGYVQYSTDGGTSWTSFPTASYSGPATLFNGVVSFSANSYPDWLTQLDLGNDPGPGPATALWKAETINLAAYQSSTNFKVRFRITSDGSFVYFGWLIDDVKITGTGQAAITWTPCGAGQELFSNVGATITYVCGTPATTVYTQPTVNHIYTATAGSVGCLQTATTTINVTATAPPSVTIAPVGGTTICSGSCVTFNATVVNGGGNPKFIWYVNGTAPGNQVNLPLGYNPNPGQNPYTICGLNNGDVVYCQVLSNAGGCVTPNPGAVSPGVTMIVNPKPSVSIDGPLARCFPATLTLTTTGTISTYEWFLGGLPTGGNTNTLNATVPGTYSCIVTSNLGCKDTSVNKVLVQQTYTLTSSVTNGTISPSGITVVNCGANQVFTYTANPGYQVCGVLIDGVLIGIPASPYTFTNVTANHTIDVQFCNPGCASVYTADAGPNASICGNATYTLGGSISSTPSVPGFAATWSTSGDGTFTPNNVFGTAATYTPGPNDIVNGTVDLSLTTNDPLGTPCAAASGTMTLLVKPFPAITVTGLLGICPAPLSSTTLTASATIATGVITGYQWYNNVPALIGALPSKNLTATGNYTVRANASNGCFAILPITIIAFTDPSIPTISGTNTICVGTTTLLTAAVAAPGNNGAVIPASGYQWFNPASIVGATSSTYNVSAPATYTVKATNSNGCSSAASVGFVVTYDGSALNGPYTIGVGPASCTNYVSFATAVADLNIRGISGNVRFDIPAGYSETVPVGGLALGSAYLNGTIGSFTIAFQKNGVGANPLLNAYIGGTATPASGSPDGIWSLRGVDNVSIDAIDLLDNTTSPFTVNSTGASAGTTINVTSTAAVAVGMTVNVTFGTGVFVAGSTVTSIVNGTQFIVSAVPSTALNATAVITFNLSASMEYGYGLFKLNNNDGTQNNTIQNCNITLKRTNDAGGAQLPEGSSGILVMNVTANNATLPLVPSAATGANSGNKFYSNVIQNCNNGIGMLGYSPASSPYNFVDNANDIGGIGVSTGNTIINYGGLVGSTSTATGIRLNNQWAANVSYNIINNNNGAGANHSGILRGIWAQGSTTASVSINNNNLTLKCIGTGQQMAAIDNAIGGATAAGNTISISNNTITGTYTTATTAAVTGIVNTGGLGATVTITGNVIDSYAMTGSGPYVGINNAVAAATVNLSNNRLSNCNIASSGTFVGISNTVGGIVNLAIIGNTINNITKVFNSGTLVLMQTSSSTGTTSVNDNIITNNTLTATAATLNVTLSCIVGNSATGASTLSNNYIFNNSITGISAALTGTVNGYNNISSPINELITNNIVRKLFVTGTSTGLSVVQAFNSNSGGAGVKTISNNTIANLYTSSGLSSTIFGIRTSGGTTINILKNKVDSLFAGQSATAGAYAAGIRVVSGTTVNVNNNFINLDLTQATAPAANAVLTGNDALRGIEHTGTVGTLNLYYNTVRLAGAGTGTGFGSSAVSINNATPPTLDLRNNILVNLTTPGGTSPGLAVAYRRAVAVSALYATTSNNNLFYAGVPSASRVLYFDGTTSYQTLGTYLAGAGISPRETASVSASPNFINPIADLHLVPGSNCTTDGGAQVIAGYTTDYDADTRSVTTPDIGADEFAGTGVGVGVWKGINTDWTDIQNWCDAIPDQKTNVIIPAGTPFYPIIITATPVCANISIAANASVTITGVGKLGIYGTTMTNAGTFNVVDGTIEMLGAATQTIPAGLFQNNDLKNLIISSTGASAGVTLGGALNVYGKVSYTVSSKAFATAGFLTLRSTATGTASLGDITNNGVNSGNTITGDVTVERFVTAKRAWRFLSVPTQNNLQTIHQAWQENQAAGVGAPAGYGVQITSNLAGWAAAGFDLFSAGGPSVKTYVPASNTYAGIPNTSSNFTTGTGYMTFVRGDRTITTFGPPPNTTVLRDKGALVTGTFAAPAIGAGLFAAIGNPHASAIDYTKLAKTNLTAFYYLWDPALGTFGAFQTVSGGIAIPGGGSYSGGHVFIESGQAFFVKSSGPAGTLSFPENSKVDGSYLVTRPAGAGKQIRTNLYLLDSTGRHLYDGVSSEFDASYAATLDEMDADKLVNFGENLGIRRGGKNLSIESMPLLVKTDTIFYNLDQMRVKNYQFEFIANDINQPGLAAFLEDLYLHVKTPVGLSDTTTVDFNIVNDPGSYAPDRFRLVFKELVPVPVTFSNVRANRQGNNILVEWKVENELNIDHYEVEKSTDGQNFTKVNSQVARGNNQGVAIQYSWLDTNPFDGNNFYRIRSVGISREAKFSQIVKVSMDKVPSLIAVYPNPIREDGIINVSLTNKPAGNYMVNMVNNEGQLIFKATLIHAGGNSVYTLSMDKYVAHGNYLMKISGEDNVNLVFKVVY